MKDPHPLNAGNKLLFFIHIDVDTFMSLTKSIDARDGIDITKNMNMIFNTINTIQVTFLIFYYTGKIGILIINMVLLNCKQTCVSENNVIQMLAVA